MSVEAAKENRIGAASVFKRGDQVTKKIGFGPTMIVLDTKDGWVTCVVPKTLEHNKFHPNDLKNHGQCGPIRPIF